MAHLVDVVIDSDFELTHQISTILDFTDDPPLMIRRGLGWQDAFDWGIEPADELSVR